MQCWKQASSRWSHQGKPGEVLPICPIAAAQIQANNTAYQYQLQGTSNWSPCPQFYPLKSILLASARPVFPRCKSDFSQRYLKPFSDLPSAWGPWPSSSARSPGSGPACFSPCFSSHSRPGKATAHVPVALGHLGCPLPLSLFSRPWNWLWHRSGCDWGSAASQLCDFPSVTNFDSWASVCNVGMIMEFAP